MWPALPVRPRRAAAALALVAGLGLAGYGAGLDGERGAATRALFLNHHCVVDEPRAPAALLPLAAAFALIAAAGAGLAGGQRISPRDLPLSRPLLMAASLVLLRFAIDRAAAPEPLAHAFGLVWMIPGLALFAHVRARAPVRDLALVALLVRLPAAAAVGAATAFDLGSHFSLVRVERIAAPWRAAPIVFEPGSLQQFAALGLLPQLVIWPLLALAAGALLLALLRRFTPTT